MITLEQNTLEAIIRDAFRAGRRAKSNMEYTVRYLLDIAKGYNKPQPTKPSAARDCIMAEHNWRKECLS